MTINPLNPSSNYNPNITSQSNESAQLLLTIESLAVYMGLLIKNSSKNFGPLFSQLLNIKNQIESGNASLSKMAEALNNLINTLNAQISPIDAFPNEFEFNSINGEIEALKNFINLALPGSPLGSQVQNILNELNQGTISQQQAAKLLQPIIKELDNNPNLTESFPYIDPNIYPN